VRRRCQAADAGAANPILNGRCTGQKARESGFSERRAAPCTRRAEQEANKEAARKARAGAAGPQDASKPTAPPKSTRNSRANRPE
jgi:hypothetical protein